MCCVITSDPEPEHMHVHSLGKQRVVSSRLEICGNLQIPTETPHVSAAYPPSMDTHSH